MMIQCVEARGHPAQHLPQIKSHNLVLLNDAPKGVANQSGFGLSAHLVPLCDGYTPGFRSTLLGHAGAILLDTTQGVVSRQLERLER